MKKYAIAVALTLLMALFSTSLYAAPALGVKGGLNIAGATKDPDGGFSVSRKVGVMIGGSIEMPLTASNKITLRGELLYVSKGWKEEGDYVWFGTPVEYEGTASVDEIDIAPFLVFRFPSGKMTPFLQVGPELGLNLSAKAKAETNGASDTDDIKDWSGMNLGLNLGAGIAVPAGNGEVVFDARYNLGLMNCYTGDNDYTVKTNGIQFLVGYNFSVPER
ncbi:PorT family protein [candidate division KSB1 bacterium]|nr:MAG: PorT family protein [candidate division KSB1 bacterium]